MKSRIVALLAPLAALGLLTGCGGDAGAKGPADGKVSVVAAFYPLEYAVAQIGGDHVDVTGLTKPGGEPHDVELTPRQVGRVTDSDLVVYLQGFQPAVDAAATREAGKNAFDVAPAARLVEAAPEDAHEGHDHGKYDPHFWLDPMRYADVGDAIADRLAAADPGHTADYRKNAETFRIAMTTLDSDFKAGLSTCTSKELVTSHAAFGYLASAYGLHQTGITGLDPEAEPDPASLAKVAAHVRKSGARTVYAETLVSPEVAKTLARETGAKLAVLDPVEAITPQSAGQDYLTVMRANLATLRTGQGCS